MDCKKTRLKFEGIVAADAECYTTFGDLFDPIISALQNDYEISREVVEERTEIVENNEEGENNNVEALLMQYECDFDTKELLLDEITVDPRGDVIEFVSISKKSLFFP